MIGALAAIVLAGWLADRVGKVRIISIYIVLMVTGWVALALTSTHWSAPGYFSGFIYTIQFLDTFGYVAMFATAMNLCWTRVAATQFTLYMVCGNIGLVVGAMLLGPLREHLSWSGMFFFLAALLMLALVLFQWMRLRIHLVSLGRSETDFAEKAARKALGREGALPVDLGVPGAVV